MVKLKGAANQEALIFSSIIYPTKTSETNAILLAASIRNFAGILSQRQIWYFKPEYGKDISKTTRSKLSSLNVNLIPFEIDYEVLKFPFTGHACAAALAESRASSNSVYLAWLANNTVILQEPKAYLLQNGKKLGYRPVHHILVGSIYDEPLDPFWTLIYHHCQVPEDRVFPMKTDIEEPRIRPYFNAGSLIIRPAMHLLQRWRDVFLETYAKPEFQDFYQQDERYAIFIHQAVLSGVILSSLSSEEIQELPSKYNYPYNLYTEDTSIDRPKMLEECVTFRHEGFYGDPEWAKKMPAKETLKEWIIERLS